MSIKVRCSASKPRKPGNLEERPNLKSIQANMDCFLLCKRMFPLSLPWFTLVRNILAGYPPLPLPCCSQLWMRRYGVLLWLLTSCLILDKYLTNFCFFKCEISELS